jgi:hypothetical protein
MATKYFALVYSLTARSNEITHHSELKGMMEFLEGEVTPKSCTSVTVTADKIVRRWGRNLRRRWGRLIFRLGGGGGVG